MAWRWGAKAKRIRNTDGELTHTKAEREVQEVTTTTTTTITVATVCNASNMPHNGPMDKAARRPLLFV